MPPQEISVSVVIPAFNRPARLETAIHSILAQTYRPLSLTVIDDASTADLSQCRELVQQNNHQWLRLPENSGPAAARNFGAANTPGDWIAFLDSDDLWHPEKLARQMAWHAANPDFRISQVRENWIRNGQPFSKPPHLEQPATGHLFETCVARCAIGPSCVVIRRDLWEETGGFDPWFRVCEDYELWLRIAQAEPIGLVGGPALIDKHGGHADQLSTATPALDRYRFVALVKFLHSSPDLPADQKQVVTAALAKKASILGKGAEKRGRNDWASFFREIQIPPNAEELKKCQSYCDQASI